MADLRVDPAIFEKWPELRIGVIELSDFHIDSDHDFLTGAETCVQANLADSWQKHPHIQAWQQTFRDFGAKPNRTPSSAQALIKRVLTGNQLPRVHPLVDLYNAISLPK